MPLTLGQNISSLKAQRQLDRSSQELSTVFQRLSSGLRINSASDDSAGLAVATSLNADARIFTQAIRNVNDGISLLNVAEGALTELTSIVTRISELATQAANGTFSRQQRQVLDAESQALAAEYQRIARSTSFNGSKLFDASFGRLTLQVGANSSGIISSGLGGAIGTGSFGTATLLNNESGTAHGYGLTLADVNADGAIDMITNGDTDAATGYFNIRLGTGTGSFGAAVSYTADALTTWKVVVTDVNNDGNVDLITAGDNGTAGTATVRLGRGDGTFGTVTSYSTETGASYGMTLGDINGDGNLDLATTGQNAGSDGYTTIRLGLGDGTFGTATSYAAETGVSREVQLGDLNGDGKLDLVSIGRTDLSVGYFTVRLGQGNGTFGASSTYVVAAAGGTFSWGMALADFNADGKLDVIGGSASSAIYLGVGDGTFTAAGTLAHGATAFNMAAGDINGDGKLDLAVANNTSTKVYLGNGDGTFLGSTSLVDGFSQTRGVGLADLNTDGVLDLVSVGSDATPDGSVNVRLANTTDGVGALLPFSLKTLSGARSAMGLMNQKLTQLSSQSAQIGSFESRLAFTTNYLNTVVLHYRDAASRILDADVASDAARLVTLQIRNQAAAAMLAHSNQSASLVLKLLRDD